MEEIIQSFFNSKESTVFILKLIFAFLVSLGLTYAAIPVILKISHRKNLMDEPRERSSHDRKVPNLGGIAIFYTIGICAPIFAYELFESYKFLFPALVILLYIGVMDDIVVIRAYKKLFAQITIAVMIVIGSDVRLRSMFGLFGIYELNYLMSVILSIIVFVVMINAFNLIDGVDGLAGSFAIICCFLFGWSYYRLGEYNYPMVMLCIIIIGALLGFLYYNLSDKKIKIFMGDTGSMIIGFLLVFTAFYFIDLFISKDNPDAPHYHLQSAPVIAFAILILPTIDTLSVIIIRLLNKKSPLEADRNHIHHRLLNLGLSHKGVTFYIILYYLGIILVTYLLRHIEINILMAIVLSLGFIGAYLPNIILKLRK